VNEGTLGSWVTTYRKNHTDEEPPLSITGRARLRELEKENRELKMKAKFLGKAEWFRGSWAEVVRVYVVAGLFDVHCCRAESVSRS
jgi:transposase